MLLGARAFLGVRFTALQALGAVVTMVGVAAIAAQGDAARLLALAFNSGDAMMLVAVVLYAGYTVALRERPPVSGLSLLAGMALAAFVTSAAADGLGDRLGRLHLADRGGTARRSSMSRSGRRSRRRCSTCAASN